MGLTLRVLLARSKKKNLTKLFSKILDLTYSFPSIRVWNQFQRSLSLDLGLFRSKWGV